MGEIHNKETTRIQKFIRLCRNFFRRVKLDHHVEWVALKTALTYAIFGILWIVISDEFLWRFTSTITHYPLYQMLKGWGYVFITGGILFFLVKKNLKVFDQGRQALKESYEELEKVHRELVATQNILNDKIKALDQSQEDLKLIEERYRLAIEGAKDGIWDWDIRTGRFLFERTKEMLGYESDEVENDHPAWMQLIHPDDIETVRRDVRQHFETKGSYFRSEYRVLAKDGNYRWILSRGQSIFDHRGKLVRMAGSHTDITEMKNLNKKMSSLAYFDQVTGLPNRSSFLEAFEKQLKNSMIKGEDLGILLMDLDNFKNTIDTLGHRYGDLLLKRVGEMVQECVEGAGVLYRLGGDEFILLLEPGNTTCERITAIAAKVLASFQSPISINHCESFVTASIGIAIAPRDGEDPETLLKNVEVAMYEAKVKGKNGFQMFNDRLKANFEARTQLGNDLRYALERHQLVVYYQPKVSLTTKQIVGGEALIRWFHPTKGFISPMEFIPLAEENGMITSIGAWVIQEVCRQNKDWQEANLPPIPLAVNISGRQFQEKNLVETIQGALATTGLEPQWLEVEITETIAMKDLNYTMKILKELRSMGIAISLDDFGTGYSSLNYLRNLPIDTVKIDKSFVHDLCHDPRQGLIADAMIAMAHGLKLTVTAEGIETEAQLQALAQRGCDFAQGYYLYKPMPPGDFEKYLRAAADANHLEIS